MTCGTCGAENRDTARFCGSCGASLVTSACPVCGSEQPGDASFCDECGHELRPDPAPTGGDGVSSTEATEAAERRPVTVLFADAKSSTALTERIGDEKMYRLMQDCVTLMQDCVERHDGTVTQFRGDGIMALFGAPRAIENAAVAAVSAALEIQEALAERGREVHTTTGIACPFRIGLNTGPVVVGRVGGETLVDYTAIGDTANVASRMEQAAGDGEVFVSDTTWRAVRDFVECEAVGPLELKGKRDPVTAHRALRRRPVTDRFDAAAARGLSEFVGRDDELSLLRGLVRRLDDGQGRVVLVSGEAGIGKSRLVRELRAVVPEHVAWLEGRSSSADREAPWHVVADLLRDAFDIGEDDDHDDISEILERRSQGWSEHARASIDHLKWLLGVPVPALDSLDPQERRAGIFEALVTAVRDGAGRRPIVISLEDLHWADEASEAAIRMLVHAVADVPVLLLVTYRPERPPDLGDRPWTAVLALDALVSDAAARLAAGNAGVTLSDEARRLVVERSEGNPLFVEELTASLIEAEVLVPESGMLVVADTTTASELPSSLQDVVLTRIDRLEDEARRALQLAAVIGREFSRRILDRIAQMPERLDAHLAELESLELIRQRAWFPELAYLFKHAVVHDVTYSTLLDERRRALHRIVAEATEDLYADRLADHCESLARHWLAAGEDERALPHLVTAAERAMAGYSVGRAAEAFDTAATIAERLGRDDVAIRLRLQRCEALVAASDPGTAVDEAERVITLARTTGATAPEAMAWAQKAMCHLYLHDFDTALETAATGAELAQTIGDAGANAIVMNGAAAMTTRAVMGEPHTASELEARVAPYLDLAAESARNEWTQLQLLRTHWRGDFDPVEAEHRAADPPAAVVQRLWIGWTVGLHFAGCGRYLDAVAGIERVLSTCERLGELLVRGRALNTLGWIHGDLGDHAEAERLDLESIHLMDAVDLPDREIEANARLNLADDCLVRGDLDGARAQVDELRRTVREPSPPEIWMLWRYRMRWLCVSGELALAGGDAEAALAFAAECIDGATETEAKKYQLRGRRVRGHSLAALGRVDQAIIELDRSLALAREVGNPPQLWRTLTARAGVGDDGSVFATEAVELIDRVVQQLGDHPLAASLARSPERARAAALT